MKERKGMFKVEVTSEPRFYPVYLKHGDRVALSYMTQPQTEIILNDQKVTMETLIDYLLKYKEGVTPIAT